MQISGDSAISDVLAAKADATQQKVAFAVARKQLDAQKVQGDAVNQMLEQVVNVQKQIAAGHLDVHA